MSRVQRSRDEARPTPWEWLWDELVLRLGEEEAKALHQEYLAVSRVYTRLRTGSSLAPDAPAQRPGPRRLAVWKEEEDEPRTNLPQNRAD